MLIILRVVKLARFFFASYLKKITCEWAKKVGSKTKCTFFIRNTTKVDRKEKKTTKLLRRHTKGVSDTETY